MLLFGQPLIGIPEHRAKPSILEVALGFKFVHMADVHLGTLQYGIEEREKDFARAFRNVAQFAVDRRADFVLIAGDLFDRGNPLPRTFGQAQEVLELLKDAGIPAVAIAGNHDRGDYRQGDVSWLTILAKDGLLTLLDYSFDAASFDLLPWDPSEIQGGYVDIGPARIIGLRYLGLTVIDVLKGLMPKIERLAAESHYTILMLHVGIQGYTLPGQAGIASMKLEPLEGRIKYLALGHVHLEYHTGNWMFNPGSLETWRMDEVKFPRGFYFVEVDDAGQHTVTHLSKEVGRRPFWVLQVDLSRCRARADMIETARREACRQQREQPLDGRYPMVVLNLTGRLSFELGPDDEDRLRQAVRDELGFDDDFLPFVRVKWSYEEAATGTGAAPSVGSIDRDALEREVWEGIYREDPAKRARAQEWAHLAMEVRRKALDARVSPKEIADLLESRYNELVQGGRP